MLIIDAIWLALAIITIVCMVTAGLSLAKIKKNKQLPAPPSPKANAPVCGCGHNLAFHSVGDNSKCQAQSSFLASEKTNDVRRYSGNDVYTLPGATKTYEQKPCACQQYVGPEYVPDFLLPELMSA